MGTRRRFRAWVPYQGLGTPSFGVLPSRQPDRPRIRGPGLLSLLERYGGVDRSINLGSPVWEGGRVVLSNQSVSGMKTLKP